MHAHSPFCGFFNDRVLKLAETGIFKGKYLALRTTIARMLALKSELFSLPEYLAWSLCHQMTLFGAPFNPNYSMKPFKGAWKI